ncbi:MAG: YbaN family protein [Peptostreptococcaceae bacterium]
MKKITKIILITVGLISFILGAIGVILPVLPTTPFLLLSSACFAKGSERFETWFTSTKLYKNHLESFVEERAMTIKQKVCLLAFADIMIAFPLIILDSVYIKIFLIAVVIFKYYYFIFRIKTIKECEF